MASRADFQSGWTRTSLSGADDAIGSDATGSGDIAPWSGAPGPLAHLRGKLRRGYIEAMSMHTVETHLANISANISARQSWIRSADEESSQRESGA